MRHFVNGDFKDVEIVELAVEVSMDRPQIIVIAIVFLILIFISSLIQCYL